MKLPNPPIYLQIARSIQNRIYHGLYPPGTAIPSENELGREFGVSRMTVRQALRQLSEQHLLVSRRGAGTYVAPNVRALRPVNFIGSLEDLILQPHVMETSVGEVESITAPLQIAEQLQLKRTEKVMVIERTRTIDNSPVSHALSYLPESVGRQIDVDLLAQSSLTTLLGQRCGIEITTASQTFTAEAAPTRTAEQLNLPRGAPVLLSEIVLSDEIQPRSLAIVRYHPAQVFFTATLTKPVGSFSRPLP